MAVIGYVRMSKEEQSLDLLRGALLEAGCESIYDLREPQPLPSAYHAVL